MADDRTELIVQIIKKLMKKMDDTLLVTSPNTAKYQLLYTFLQTMAYFATSGKEACVFVEQFLLPFWVKKEGQEEYAFDTDKLEEQSKKSDSLKQVLGYELEPAETTKLNLEMKELTSKYFEAMCDVYTAK